MHLQFNTAIAKLIELNNHVTKVAATPRDVAEPLVLMVAPLAPHIAEELWRAVGPIRVARLRRVPRGRPGAPGRRHGRDPGAGERQGAWPRDVATDADAATVEAVALADEKVVAALDGASPKKVVVVPGRMVNFVI